MRNIFFNTSRTFSNILNSKRTVPNAISLSTVGRSYTFSGIIISSKHKASFSSLVATESKTFNEEIEFKILLPDNEEGYKTFKKIVTNENITFTYSLINKKFKISELKEYCSDFIIKLKLALKGDKHLKDLREEAEKHHDGVSLMQIALDNFFKQDINDKILRQIYNEISAYASQTGLGYYQFENKDGKLLGGGALVPISDENKNDAVDIALHILEPRKGIGSICINKLLCKAFEEHKIKEVWGSSIITHPTTPTLCAKYGMIIHNDNGMKYYFIDKAMWDINKQKLEYVSSNLRSAADKYWSNSK